jgi:hypothetical protein
VRRALALLLLLPALSGCGQVPRPVAGLTCARLQADPEQFRPVARLILDHQPGLSAGALSLSDAILSIETQVRRMCAQAGWDAVRPLARRWSLTPRAATPPP